MKLSRIVVLAAIVVVAASILRETLAQPAAPPPATTAPAAEPTRVAVVDVMELFDNYKKAKDLLKGLNDRKAADDVEDQKRKEGIDRLEAEIANLNPGVPEYEKRFNEMQRLGIEREVWRKFEQTVLAGEYHRLSKMLYDEIKDMVARVAKEQGIQIVLTFERKGPSSANMNELSKIIETRKVLYCDNNVDITETVLRRLNEADRTAPAPAK